MPGQGPHRPSVPLRSLVQLPLERVLEGRRPALLYERLQPAPLQVSRTTVRDAVGGKRFGSRRSAVAPIEGTVRGSPAASMTSSAEPFPVESLSQLLKAAAASRTYRASSQSQ